MLVNSLDYDNINLYAGVWGGKAGKFWLDDFSIEEVGPINVLRRPGTPVTVKSEEISLELFAFGPLVVPLNLVPPLLNSTSSGRHRVIF